jgi:hypothetical protein
MWIKFKSIPKKRRLLILGVAAAVFAGVFAFAASLTVNSGSLGAGNASVSSCDTDGVTASYSTTYNSGYKVGSISVAGIADACGTGSGTAVSATLTGTGTNLPQTVNLGTYTGTSGQLAGNIASANQPLAADVTGVSAVING